MLPNIDINSVSGDSVSVNHVLPGSELMLPPGNAVIQVSIVSMSVNSNWLKKRLC